MVMFYLQLEPTDSQEVFALTLVMLVGLKKSHNSFMINIKHCTIVYPPVKMNCVFYVKFVKLVSANTSSLDLVTSDLIKRCISKTKIRKE